MLASPLSEASGRRRENPFHWEELPPSLCTGSAPNDPTSTGLSAQLQPPVEPRASEGRRVKLADYLAAVPRCTYQTHSGPPSKMPLTYGSGSRDAQPATPYELTAQTTPLPSYTEATVGTGLISCRGSPVYTVPSSGGPVAAEQGRPPPSPETNVTDGLCKSPGSGASLRETPFALQCAVPSPSSAQVDKSSESYSAGTPDSGNCALRILNLPEDVTCGELLSHIIGMGRVYSTEINKSVSEDVVTASAKIEFFTHDAANAFRISVWRDGLVIQGRPACVTWYRGRSEEVNASGDASRVLIVQGLSMVVNDRYLTKLFSFRFTSDLVRVIVHIDTGYWAKVELQFRSYGQAAEAKGAGGDGVGCWVRG